MTKLVYSVYDHKACCFSNPFVAPNNNVALRSFHQASTDENSEISKYPNDYSLFNLGSFNDETGALTPLNPIENLVTASSFKEK